MLEFIHNIGSKVFNFFSTTFGNEGTKRQRDGFPDEFSSDYSPVKRVRLDMEPDSSVGFRFPAADTKFRDRYYYRSDITSSSMPTAQSEIGRTSSGSVTFNSRTLSSGSKGQMTMTGTTTSKDSLDGFNFADARHRLQDSSAFQFTSNTGAVKFQGGSSRDAVTNRASSSGQSVAYNRPIIGGRNDTPRLNGAGESKHRSVFSRILGGGGGGDSSRGIKCIDTRRRNKMAVKQCVRLNEKILYQDMLNRHLVHPAATPPLPSYSLERHNRPLVEKTEERNSSIWRGTPLFDRSSLLSSTKVNEITVTDSIKHRLDASTSLLRGLSSAPLPAWRQSLTVRRKQSPADFPERTLQTLQKQRHQPMRVPPRNEFENQPPVVENNRPADNSSLLRKSCVKSDQRKNSVSISPITIGSSDYDTGRRSSKDSEIEVLVESPGVNDSNHKEGSNKESLHEKSRSSMPEIFEKTLKESRYAKKEFMLQVNSKTQSEFAKQELLEKETTVKYYKDQRSKSESQLINEVKNLLRISERLPVPLDETFVEEEPEEEEDICEIIDDEEEEEVEDTSNEFPELTEEQDAAVSRALIPRPPDQPMVEGFRLQITGKDLATLSGLNWLNDEIINFYLNLVMERSEKQQGSRKVYAFSTFFYPKVKSDGHKGVRRWTKTVDLFTFDYILVPVHLGMHWCLAVIDFRKKELRYYDSMGGNNEECLRALRNYLSEECQAKRQTTFDWTGWQFFAVKNIPQQMNGSDCGMFACKFAEYISRDAAITFDQRHMPYFRRRMVHEIITKRLM